MRNTNLMLFAALVVIATVHCQSTPEKVKVNVSVYYESLCPDSKRFINTQLYPALTSANASLVDHVNLRLIPYGKSTYSLKKTTSQEYTFTCHHGAVECVGNKYHACALNDTLPPQDAAHQHQQQRRFVQRPALDYVNCLMAKADGGKQDDTAFPIKECAVDAPGINAATRVENCGKHSDAGRYLHAFGVETEALQPALTNVPWITLDGVRDADAEWKFVDAVCAKLRAKNPTAVLPLACVTVTPVTTPVTPRTEVPKTTTARKVASTASLIATWPMILLVGIFTF